MNIRPYEDKDLEIVLTLHQKAMEVIGAYKGDGEWDNDLKNIERVYLENNGDFLIGEVNGNIVAMGAYKKSEDGYAEVKRMRVFPEYQGYGYGSEILRNLENSARKKGYKGFILETSIIQTAAQNLYKKFGFKEFMRETIDGFECIWFKKDFK